ncbi:MAG: C25 family cysteine peptidase [Prolixibacteraceae bacterium]|jgi:hypothetical protein|nr:C25 family cysteine peptidase [Prolixibacteraceae bacterium]
MKVKTYMLSIIICLLFTNKINGQINYNVQFSDEYCIIPVQLEDGNTYDKIDIDGLECIDSIGFPAMPVKYVNLIVPYDATVTGVDIEHSKVERIKLNNLMQPVQSPMTYSQGDYIKKFVKPEMSKYYSDDLYPTSRVTVINESYYRNNKIITLAVCPFQYQPKNNHLYFVKYVDLVLKYSTKTDPDKIRMPIKRNSLTNKVLSSIVDNKEDVDLYGAEYMIDNHKTKKELFSSQTVRSYSITNGINIDADYVIVTSEALAPSFNEFINWKRRKGFDIELVTIEEIIDKYPDGDLISGIDDEAGSLRQFLFEAYNGGNGIDYVLLGGDNTVLPIRKAYEYSYVSENDPEEDYIIPTDLYFAEFDGDWNVDSDPYYGEPSSGIDGDNVSYKQEIYIGRIMVKIANEVKNWTKKIKAYEINPGNGDPSYVTKAFFTQADHHQIDNNAREILSKATWLTGDTTVWGEAGGGCTTSLPTFPTGSDVISEFNNHYGFCSFLTHGSPCNVAVATSYLNSYYNCDWTKLPNTSLPNTKYKVTAFDNGVNGCCMVSENGNGFDNMTNVDYPTIFYSISCSTMPFDDYLHEISIEERNMGESYTCISNGGGPIYLGNTRFGIPEYSIPLFKRFVEEIVDHSIFNVGIAEELSKELFNIGGTKRHPTFSHNLLGCPETEIWTGIPTNFTPSISSNGSTVTVNSYESGSTICLMSALDNGATIHEVDSLVTSSTFNDPGVPYYITISKHNKMPYLRNPTNVILQNKTFSGNTYLECSSILAGYNVDQQSTFGNVVIADGAVVTFDASNGVELRNGFEVEIGAVFEISVSGI